MKRILLLIPAIMLMWPTRAQQDTLYAPRIEAVPCIISAGMYGMGLSMHYAAPLLQLNRTLQDGMQQWRNEGPLQGRRIHMDDATQWIALPSMYLLKAMGVPARDSYWEMTTLSAEAYGTMLILVNAQKYTLGILRPDGSAHNSFPSGHTATAFCGAELLRIQFRDATPWVGIAGYTAATLTGVMRVYNNRHWTGDVLGGAAVGIISAQLANWLNPKVQRWLTPQSKTSIPSSTTPQL